MHILFLSRWYPFPPTNGSKLRIYNLLKAICSRHTITLLTFIEPGESISPPAVSIQNLVEIQTILRKPFNPTGWRARLGLFSPKPRFVIDTYSVEMENAIRNVLQKTNVDLVIASQFDMAIYRPVFRDTAAIFEEIEIGVFSQRVVEAKYFLQQFRSWLTWAKHRRYLGQLLSSFQLGTVVSAREAELVRDAFSVSNLVKIVPNCINLADYEGYHTTTPNPKRLIFTGSFSYEPNYQAMRWFVDSVFPLVLQSHPDTQLVITGDIAGKDLGGSGNIMQTGMVDDIRPWVAGAWISLAPIQTGGGTRLKILEAMGLRSAVISTNKGVEGLDIEPDEHLLVADTPDDFLAAVRKLLDDPFLRAQLTTNAYQLVKEKYDLVGQTSNILNIIDQVTLKYSRNRL